MPPGEEPDLEGRGALLESRPGRVPFPRALGALAIVALCGLGALVLVPKMSLERGGSSDLISLEERSIEEQIEDPKCHDFKKLKIIEVLHNNLAGKGPDDGAEGIEYHIKTHQGNEYIMDVHAQKSFDFVHHMVGMHGDYGRINVNGKETAWLNVSFRDFETHKPAILSDFTLTFFDIDKGAHNKGLEAITIEGDWSMAVVAKDTTVLVHHTEDNQRQVTFQGTNRSAPSDDPAAPHILDLNQYNKAVTVRFQSANNFRLGLHVKTQNNYARVFEFIGYASVLCAESPNKGEELPVGEVYVNEDQLSKAHLSPKGDEGFPWGWLLLGCILGCALVAAFIPLCLKGSKTEYRELEAAPPPPPKQGPGIYDVQFQGKAKLGLHLDAPEGLGVPPMIKKINEGAVETFNKQGKPNAIEAHDMIIKVGEVSDPNRIMAELKKGLPAEARLTLDRPYHIETTLNGNLGVKLDSLEDSYGAVIVDIEAKGSIADYNKKNPTRKMNKGDRIVSLNGQTFDPKLGWTARAKKSGEEESSAAKSGFGSRQNSRFLEEMNDFLDKDVTIVMLKFTSNEK